MPLVFLGFIFRLIKWCIENALFRNPEHAVPTDAAVFLVHGEPYEDGLANDVVFWDIAPIARVS